MIEWIRMHDIEIEIQGHTLLEKGNGTVNKGDVIGIIGKNGAGKSTLLNLLNKKIAPTKGQLIYGQEDLKVSMVEQETESYLMDRLTTDELTLLKHWHVPAHHFEKLSGGEKLKARLAKGFTTYCDLLLLDEPTNHLDEQSLAFLTKQLKAYNGTIVLVSHDRAFLDSVATKIWAIENRSLVEHKGNYTSYIKAREEKRAAQQREYEKQQKKIKRIENQMNQLSSWSSKAHSQSTKQEGFKEFYRVKAKKIDSQVKSKQKRLENELEQVKVDQVSPEYEVQFTMKASGKKGRRFLEVKALHKAFGDRVLFTNSHFTIQHGEKVAITGPNGSGKTTFLQMIVGEEPFEGDVWKSSSATIGYLTQEVFDLPLDQMPEQLFYQKTYEDRGHVQNLMKHLGFKASQWSEPIELMSMGERVKLKLMKYILEEKDVLVLDEPTNHLDLESREQLEDTLAQYSGTMLVVSHDRYFLEQTTNTKLVIAKGRITKQLGGEQAPNKKENNEEVRMTLETERQEVLGKLSFAKPGSKEYTELDAKFTELTKQIKALS